MSRAHIAAFSRAATACLCAVPALAAQLAGEIAAEHRAGQTFVTWRESALLGVRYRVYRANAPILGPGDLLGADLLGEVDDKSSHNQERSVVEHGERTWIIADGAAPLAVNQGLFVHTVEADAPQAFYAVTSFRRGVENTAITPAVNATVDGLVELAAPPEPVLQAQTSVRETWAHWVSDRASPFQPALSLTPSHGFDFCLEPGTASGPRGLVLRLYSAGGNYAQGWPPRGLVPADVDVLALSDLHAGTGFTFWFGTHELFPGAPAADTRVWNFTQDRVLWTLDWMSARLGAALDPGRVSVIGSSLGAIGGMYLLERVPERFSAALLRNGNYDLQAGDLADTSVFEKLYGPFALDLPTRAGLPILERTNARFMANLDPAVDWPLVRTINGRQDTRVGWRSAVSLFAGLAESDRPAVNYFDDRTHNPKGYWSQLERALVKRTTDLRSDRPSLRFGACTLDDDAGDGTRTSGTTVGTIDGYVDYDPTTASATSDALNFDVFLRAQKTLDDARAELGFATLTPRRTAPFALAPDEIAHFTLSEGASLVDEHWLVPDAHGLVHTPLVPLTKTPRQALFERVLVNACTAGGLALARAPLAGDELQALLCGPARARWSLYVTLGSARGPCAVRALSAGSSGTLDARGLADVRFELAPRVPAGTWIWARGRIGNTWTPWSTAVVQPGLGPRSSAGARAVLEPRR